MNIQEGNKLIVDFLGGKYVGKERMDGHDYDMFDLPASFPIKLSEPDMFGMKRTGYLGFHLQWDWLMPVVEKIETDASQETGHNEIHITENTCEIFRMSYVKPQFKHFDPKSKIGAVWNVVIQYIQWYNNQQTSQP